MSRKKGRPCKYGYQDLNAGEEIQISGSHPYLRQAQRSALAYASRKDWKISTWTLEGSMTILRIR